MTHRWEISSQSTADGRISWVSDSKKVPDPHFTLTVTEGDRTFTVAGPSMCINCYLVPVYNPIEYFVIKMSNFFGMIYGKIFGRNRC